MPSSNPMSMQPMFLNGEQTPNKNDPNDPKMAQRDAENEKNA